MVPSEMPSPVVLDIDQSVGELPDALVIPLADWHERLRFGCSLATLSQFRKVLERQLPPAHASVLFGSGDFHHLSWPLIARLAGRGRFQVVVLDNHPDNMRFPFGVHCGSWVRKVAALDCVSHVHVLGITSTDIGLGHAWENTLMPLLRGRLSYWSIGVDVSWAHALGLGRRFRRFDSADDLVAAFVAEQEPNAQPSYLSIDKDVFAEDVARTNWDQGCMQLEHALALIGSLKGRIIGSDINGDVSVHRYRSWWKRRLSAIDAQPEIDPALLDDWQAQQRRLNTRLLAAIAACVECPRTA
jgi:hypothetical protein